MRVSSGQDDSGTTAADAEPAALPGAGVLPVRAGLVGGLLTPAPFFCGWCLVGPAAVAELVAAPEEEEDEEEDEEEEDEELVLRVAGEKCSPLSAQYLLW